MGLSDFAKIGQLLWDRQNIVLGLVILVAYMTYRLGTNHFAHLSKDIGEVKDSQTRIHTKVDGLTERVAHIEGKLDRE